MFSSGDTQNLLILTTKKNSACIGPTVRMWPFDNLKLRGVERSGTQFGPFCDFVEVMTPALGNE